MNFRSAAAGNQTVESKSSIGLRIDAGSRRRSEIIRIHLDGHVGNGLPRIQKRNPAGDAVYRRIAQPEIDRTLLFANSHSQRFRIIDSRCRRIKDGFKLSPRGLVRVIVADSLQEIPARRKVRNPVFSLRIGLCRAPYPQIDLTLTVTLHARSYSHVRNG